MTSQHTGIEWTDRTWNPVTGCTKVSPGCAHCYAEGVAMRFWPSQYPPVEYSYHDPTISSQVDDVRPRKFTDVQTHEDRLLEPLSWRKPQRIFVNSMSDLFHEDVPDAFIDWVFAVMALAPQHTFQVLTKRPERMRAYLTEPDGDDSEFRIGGKVFKFPTAAERRVTQRMHECEWLPRNGRPYPRWPNDWPLPNVWLGVSVENQHFADERIPSLLQTPAVRRFVSAEPLLAPMDLRAWLSPKHQDVTDGSLSPARAHAINFPPLLGWVIVGGESGALARPFDISWARDLRDQCRKAGVACFIKQLGRRPLAPLPSACLFGDDATVGRCDVATAGDILCTGVEMALGDRKGGDMAEWPPDLRVREFPRC